MQELNKEQVVNISGGAVSCRCLVDGHEQFSILTSDEGKCMAECCLDTAMEYCVSKVTKRLLKNTKKNPEECHSCGDVKYTKLITGLPISY